MADLRRRVLTGYAAVGFAALVTAACYPREAAQQRKEAALERDPVPPSYSGPLTIEYSGMGHEIIYSDHLWRRTELILSTGAGHTIDDPKQGKVFLWKDWAPNEPVEVRTLNSATVKERKSWHGIARARRMGPCEFAGEAGAFYRQVRGPGFKGPYLVRYQACLSPDGILLADGYVSEDEVFHPSKQALKVVRGPVPEGIFVPPSRPTKDT